jgi:hypothetical protein
MGLEAAGHETGDTVLEAVGHIEALEVAGGYFVDMGRLPALRRRLTEQLGRFPRWIDAQKTDH